MMKIIRSETVPVTEDDLKILNGSTYVPYPFGHLTRLEIPANSIVTAPLYEELIAALQHNIHLEQLFFGDNPFVDAAAEALAGIMTTHRYLQRLSIGKSDFTTRGIDALIGGLIKNHSIRRFDCGSSMTAEQQDVLKGLIRMNKMLDVQEYQQAYQRMQRAREQLELTRKYAPDGLDGLDKDLSIYLESIISYQDAVNELEEKLSNIKPADDFQRRKLFAISEMLATDRKTVSVLDLSGQPHERSKQAIITLAKYLPKLSCVLELNLESSNLDDVDTQTLVAGLEANQTLQRLNYGFNQCRGVGASAFAHMLATHASLQSIDLRYNKIPDAGVIAIAQALVTNTHLEEINLWGTGTESVVMAFLEPLRQNKNLKRVKLFDTEVPPSESLQTALIAFMKENRVIEQLNIGFNCSWDTGYKLGELAVRILMNNHTLQELTLWSESYLEPSMGGGTVHHLLEVNKMFTEYARASRQLQTTMERYYKNPTGQQEITAFIIAVLAYRATELKTETEITKMSNSNNVNSDNFNRPKDWQYYNEKLNNLHELIRRDMQELQGFTWSHLERKLKECIAKPQDAESAKVLMAAIETYLSMHDRIAPVAATAESDNVDFNEQREEFLESCKPDRIKLVTALAPIDLFAALEFGLSECNNSEMMTTFILDQLHNLGLLRPKLKNLDAEKLLLTLFSFAPNQFSINSHRAGTLLHSLVTQTPDVSNPKPLVVKPTLQEWLQTLTQSGKMSVEQEVIVETLINLDKELNKIIIKSPDNAASIFVKQQQLADLLAIFLQDPALCRTIASEALLPEPYLQLCLQALAKHFTQKDPQAFIDYCIDELAKPDAEVAQQATVPAAKTQSSVLAAPASPAALFKPTAAAEREELSLKPPAPGQEI